MLGLVSCTNLMDTLVYPPHHTLGLRLPISRRSYNQNSPVSPEPDPILEDTPDIPDDRDVDYSIVPPDVGLNVLVDEIGCEVSPPDTPSKQGKRALCSFSSNGALTGEDLDDYPFHVVSYGENSSCFGLPYNDHNYASTKTQSRIIAPVSTVNVSVPNGENEDRLALLAKLALAKDGKQSTKLDACDHKVTPSVIAERRQSHDNSTPALVLVSASDSVQQLSPPRLNITKSSPDTFTSISGFPTLDARPLTASSVRPLPVPCSNTVKTLTPPPTKNNPPPPLQVHRVTSSLTPHVVLRTGVPGLQISTTVSRIPSSSYPVDSSNCVRCVCGYAHADGCVVQCEKCCSWLHADCIAPANGAAIPSPYVCERCTAPQPAPITTLTIQRHQLSNPTGKIATGNTSIRVSRTAALGTGSASNRIFVTPAVNTVSSRQLHLCLPHSTHTTVQVSRADMQALPATSGTPRYISLVTQSMPYVTQAQPLRSSKRKQDLLTLTGISTNAGLECLPDSNDISTETITNQPTEMHIAASNEPTVSTISSPIGTVIAKNVYTTVSEMTGSTGKMTGSSLHRLLMQSPDHHPPPHQQQQRRNSLANGIEEVRIDGSSPMSTISSDSVRSPPLDGYEEASDLRVSDRLFDKLESMIPSNDPVSAINSLSAFSMDNVPPQLSSMHRCQVVCFEFNRKGLVASEDLCPQQPVIEYRGLCMLLSEYNEMYDYRKHYNPFVLFYKTWPKMALCVDARKYGNEARFIRRSCTPNCEVKHCVSVTIDPLSGPIPRIRLLIIANRPIMRNTELTLPFDFDFMACRYLVKCACTRKVCPVARWFRQTTQTDTTLHNPNSSSLMYSRKLPYNSRTTASSNIRSHRGMAPSAQDNYSDILADSFDADERHGSNNWNDNRLDVDSLPPIGRLWPHRTFRRVARVSSSAHRPSGITRPVARRGRTRGRHRTTNDLGKLTTLRDSTKGLLKPATRGRPPRSRSRLRLSGHQRRRGTNIIGRPRMHGRHSHSETYHYTQDVDESDQEFSESVLSLNSPPRELSINSKMRERRQIDVTTDSGDAQSKQSHQWMMSTDDLDEDTEPEYESDRNTNTPNKHQVFSKSRAFLSPRHTLFNENSQSFSLPEVSTSTSDAILLGLERDARKPSKSAKNQVVDLPERRKRRISGADGNAQSPPPKKVSTPPLENKKKSREEIWMDEVLRRIERMEKKQQQHKQRPITAERHKVHKPIESNTQIDDTLSHSVNSAPNKSDPEDLSEKCVSITESFVPEPLVFDEHNAHEETQLVSPKILEPPTSTLTSPLLEKIKNEISSQMIECSKRVEDSENLDVFVQNGFTQLHFGSPISPKSPGKSIDIDKTDGKHKSSAMSSLRKKRRRSQTTVLSDTQNSIERHVSREDRWLKSQLRRIAELEDSVTGTTKEQTATTDLLMNNDDSTEPAGMEHGWAQDGIIGKEQSDVTHDDTSLSSSLETENRRQRRQSSPSGQTDSSGRSNGQSPSAKCGDLINPVTTWPDSEADCRLIVYRTREKDPMAKFSRNRKVGVGIGEAPTDHAPEPTTEEIQITEPVSCVGPATSNATTISTHSTPRPTKKRWLSQALMEEEEDSNQNAKLDPIYVSDPIGERIFNPEEGSLIDRTLVHTPHSVFAPCPVNPKKRLISQFSGAGDEHPVCTLPPQSDSASSFHTPFREYSTSSAKLEDNTVQSTEAKLSRDHSSVEVDKPSMELSASHSTPLPPKKATVKQQAEQLRQQEMRKVRLSLSEYRRRRGLSSTSSVSNANKLPEDTPKPDQHVPKQSLVEQLKSILPPGLIDPGVLVEELPKYYDQLRRSPTVANEYARKTELDSCPTTTFQSSQQFVGKSIIDMEPSALDERLAERGPRTPSEPPDDDDDDLGAELPNTVYGRQVNVLPLNAAAANTTETSNGRCWSKDRSSQRTTDISSYMYQTGCPTSSDTKLVPIISHSQFPRATECHPGVNGSCIASHVASSESQLSIKSPREQVGYVNKNIHSPCKPLESFDEDDILRSGSRQRNHSSSLSASTGSPNHSSTPPPPPPPIPLTLSANTLVDFDPTSHKVPTPQRRFSGSDVTTTYDLSDSVPETNSLEYFIQRDQEIRHWQETRSYEWDQIRRSSHRGPVAAETQTYARHCRPQRNHTWRNSSNAYRHHINQFRSGLNGKYARHADSRIPGQLLDVEETLHRLENTLRAQLDRTQLALTPHNNQASVDRTSSLNGTSFAMLTTGILSYPRDHLELNRHIGMTEQRIHTSSSPG